MTVGEASQIIGVDQGGYVYRCPLPLEELQAAVYHRSLGWDQANLQQWGYDKGCVTFTDANSSRDYRKGVLVAVRPHPRRFFEWGPETRYLRAATVSPDGSSSQQ